MPRGAMPVNVGRGKHVVDEDLIKALDSGQLSYAALDAAINCISLRRLQRPGEGSGIGWEF